MKNFIIQNLILKSCFFCFKNYFNFKIFETFLSTLKNYLNFIIILKMSGHMCSICLHKFTSSIGYSQHRNSCVKTVDYDNDSQMPLNPYSKSYSFTKDFKNNRPSNENTVNLFSRTSKKISISSIKFGKQSHKSADNFSQIASKEKNLCNILKDFEVDNYMSSELEDENDISFEVAADNNEEFFKILQDTLPNFKDISKEIEPSKFCDELSSSDEVNSKKYKDFPNEAYANLMALVTKFKLSNAVGNAIIKFFNKHSKLSKSPLPSNISQGKTYMNNMESDLPYKKTCVLKHNDSEYFLHYIPILKCIKNILKVPDLIQNFATDYEELSKISEVCFIFYIILIYKFIYNFIFYRTAKKFFIEKKIMEYGGNLRKILCPWALKFYQLFRILTQPTMIN